jgi:hypothetical protein
MQIVFQPTEGRVPLDEDSPISKLPTISLAVIQTVFAKVGRSRVEERVSARPNGIIGGIQPCRVKAISKDGRNKGKMTHLEQAREPNNHFPA